MNVLKKTSLTGYRNNETRVIFSSRTEKLIASYLKGSVKLIQTIEEIESDWHIGLGTINELMLEAVPSLTVETAGFDRYSVMEVSELGEEYTDAYETDADRQQYLVYPDWAHRQLGMLHERFQKLDRRRRNSTQY